MRDRNSPDSRSDTQPVPRRFRPARRAAAGGVGLAALLTAGLAAMPVHAQDAARQTLTNDWFGQGDAMRNAGVNLQLEWRQYYQGMPRGTGDPDPAYGGEFSLTSHLDLSKMGFWDGFSLTAQALAKTGRGLNNAGGTLLPVNAGLYFPGHQGADRYDLAALFVTQQFSNGVSASIGKINAVDLVRGTPIRGGIGADRFWHLQFTAPLSGIVPPTFNGAVVAIPTQPVSYTLMVFDPVDATNRPLFSDVFDEGVAVSGTATYAAKLGGHDGYYSLTGMYSSREGTDFSQLIVPPGTPQGQRDGAWMLGFSFQQYLHQDPANPGRGWGVFGEVDLADGNPNPLQWAASFGVAGNDLIAGRPDDSLGLGVFHVETSDALKAELAPYFNLGDESGIEMFYTAAINPWFHVTMDLQYVDPAPNDLDDGLFVGIGTSLKF